MQNNKVVQHAWWLGKRSCKVPAKGHQHMCGAVPCLSPCNSMKYATKTFVQKPCRDAAEIYLSICLLIISVLFPHPLFWAISQGLQSTELWVALYRGIMKTPKWNVTKKRRKKNSFQFGEGFRLTSEEATAEVAGVIQRVSVPVEPIAGDA